MFLACVDGIRSVDWFWLDVLLYRQMSFLNRKGGLLFPMQSYKKDARMPQSCSQKVDFHVQHRPRSPSQSIHQVPNSSKPSSSSLLVTFTPRPPNPQTTNGFSTLPPTPNVVHPSKNPAIASPPTPLLIPVSSSQLECNPTNCPVLLSKSGAPLCPQ